MSEQLAGGTVESSIDYNDDDDLEAMLAMGEAFAVGKKDQEKKEAEYNKTVAELEARFGLQQFSYPPHVGTITDIINLCTAVTQLIPQGPDAVASFVSGHEVSNEEADAIRNAKNIENKPPVDDEVITPPVIAEEAKADPKPVPAVSNIKKPTENKKAKQTTVEAPEPATEQMIERDAVATPTMSVEPVIALDEAPVQIIEQQIGNDPSETKSDNRSSQVTEQQSQEVVSADRDASVSPQEKVLARNKGATETVSKATVGQKQDTEAYSQPLSPSSEKIQPLEAVTKPVEKDTLEIEMPVEQAIEQIGIEEATPEIFHVPHVETVHETIEPIAEIDISDEIITETESEVVIVDTAEEYLLSMDMAVEQIEQVEESVDADSEIVDLTELNAEEADARDSESMIDSEESDPESELAPGGLQLALEREQAESESEVEKPETIRDEVIAAIATELVGEAPDVQDEIEYDPEIIQKYVAAVAEHIEVLESSTNEQECRDAIIGLRKELANLLAALGYQDIDRQVEQIIRNNHNMTELKRIIESLLRAAIVDESITDTVKTTVRPHHKFGQWVVGRTTMILRAA